MEKLDPAVFEVASALLLLVAEEIDAEEADADHHDQDHQPGFLVHGTVPYVWVMGRSIR